MRNIFKKASFFSNDSVLFVSSFIILACLFLSISFPAKSGIQQITKNMSFLVIIPILYIKLVLKKNLKDYGLTFSNNKNKKNIIILTSIVFFFSLLVVYALINYTNFKKDYHLESYIINNFWFFMTYELILVNILLFIQTFFYQGFIMFTYLKKLNHWSIFIQFFLYVINITILGSFSWQMVPFIIISLTGGLITYKSRSFIYSYIMGLLFIIILDSYIIYTIK